MGNHSGGSDSYYFPSSDWDAASGGISVNLEAKDWIYLPAGTNMNTCIRLNLHVTSNVWVRKKTVGTDYCESELDGYVTYTSYPMLRAN